MTIETKEAEAVMKRCQIGTRNYEDANNLHAECYGTIGDLLSERDALKAQIDSGVRVLSYKRGDILVATTDYPEKNNATLILD